MPRTRQQQSAPKSARVTRANARMHAAVNPSDVNLMSLPTECLVEVLRFLDIHELLVSAWTCHRLFDVAQDDTLWDRTHFSTANWADALRSHFEADPKAFEDHTGIWTRCKCLLTKANLMCRKVDLDYVDRGEGVCYRLLRSVSCLQQLHHPNIVPLVFINLEPEANVLRLFYEDAGNPLEEKLKHGKLPLPQARQILRQILIALAHCHCQGITHRNIKPKYVLLRRPPGAPRGEWAVKLSDFNSVRWLGAQHCAGNDDEPVYGFNHVAGACSPTVVTQPYRAPEILLGCTSYHTAIDIWACGCVFAEMCSSSILFAGDSDIGQLIRIFELLGTPGEGKAVPWPGVEHLPYYNPEFPTMRPKDLKAFAATRELCKSAAAEDLLRRMLCFDPSLRISAEDALRHPFLRPDSPPPELPPFALHAQERRALESPHHHIREGANCCQTPDGANAAEDDHVAKAVTLVAVPRQKAKVDSAAESSTASGGAGRGAGGGGAGSGLGGGSGEDGGSPPPISSGGRSASFGGAASSSSSSLSTTLAPPTASTPCVWNVWKTIELQQRGDNLRQRSRIDTSVDKRPAGSIAEAGAALLAASNEEARRRGEFAEGREQAVLWVLNSSRRPDGFCKCDRTVHLAVAILDQACRALPKPPAGLEIKPPSYGWAHSDGLNGMNDLATASWVELLGIASLLLACKFQEVEIHMVEEFVYWAESKYRPQDVLDAEVQICSILTLDLAIPTSVDFLFCLLQRLRWPSLFAVHRGLHAQAAMLAQLLCELSLLSPRIAQCPRASLVASAALCLSLACLRCGVWIDGSPGPASSPEQYWTPSMAQTTGYTRDDLRPLVEGLRTIHEEAADELSMTPLGQHGEHGGGMQDATTKFGVLRQKYSEQRFLGVLKVAPFSPHAGGSICSPLHEPLPRTAISSPLLLHEAQDD